MRRRNLLFITLILLAGPRASSGEVKTPVREPVREISECGEIFFRVKITAYTSSADECGNDLGITSSGELARDGIVACNFLPRGTRIKIPALFGNKEFVVKDRMKRRKWNFVDVWVETKKTAFQIGKRASKIVILSS